MINTRHNSKIIFSGLEGSGKSLKMASYVVSAVKRNGRYYKITGVVRPIYSNMRFSSKLESMAHSRGVPIVYWENLEELVGLSGCDIFIDEIGTYFDARLWTELPLSVRRWLAQCDKAGVILYGTAQDFAQVDKSFRRLVKKLVHCTKFVGSPRPHISYPPVRFPWGLFFMRNINPKAYKEDNPQPEGKGLLGGGFPVPFLLHKEDYQVYDTNAGVQESKPLPLRHLVRTCLTCGKVAISHS